MRNVRETEGYEATYRELMDVPTDAEIHEMFMKAIENAERRGHVDDASERTAEILNELHN